MSKISEEAANWARKIGYRCPKCGSNDFWHEWLKFEVVTFPNKSHKDVSYAPRDSRPPAAIHVGCNRCDERIVKDGEFVAGKSRPVEEVREEHRCLDEHRDSPVCFSGRQVSSLLRFITKWAPELVAMSKVADPTTVKLTQTTIQQLRQRYDDQDSADELISDLLDETRNSVTLTEFIDLLVDAVDPVQIALYENSDPARGALYDFSGLVFVVNTESTREDLEAAVEGIDAVEVDGTPFSFAVEHDPYGPQDLGRLSVYTTVELTEMSEKGDEDRVKPPVSREEGVEKVEACIRSNEVSNPL